MKGIVFTALFFFASFFAQGQTFIQISGEIIRPPNDTIKIECFSDGELIDIDVFVGKFYNFTLGSMPHYTLKIQSGGKVKYCQVVCNMMTTEKIIVDVDFSSNFNSIIYLDKPSDKFFTMLLYDKYRVKIAEIERSYSQY